ncbi:MAG: hypothetical protein J0I73_06110, partial [Sphingomonas sp.]|uniref:hypothetical protein n=1 Tax=Sphingomonas sp. TaxID=28214 RepID=UPI001AC546F5
PLDQHRAGTIPSVIESIPLEWIELPGLKLPGDSMSSIERARLDARHSGVTCARIIESTPCGRD